MKKILILTLSLLLCLWSLTSCCTMLTGLIGRGEAESSEENSSGDENINHTSQTEANEDSSVEDPAKNPEEDLSEEPSKKPDEDSSEEPATNPEDNSSEDDDSDNSSEESGNDTTEAHEHSYGEWSVTKAPTCTAKGEKERECACGESQTDEIDALGHIEIYHSAKSPTCSDAGWDAYVTCSECDYSTKVEKYAPHSWKSEYLFDTEYHWYECSDCGAENTKQSHTIDSNYYCRVCNQTVNSTAGVVYAISSNGNYAVVIDYTGSASRVTIASFFEGVPVKAINENAFKDKAITEVIIPDRVEMIGKHAFSGCASLKSITIPDSVTSIAQYAFYNCSSLESMTIPFVGASKDNAKNAYLAYIFGTDGYGGNSNRYVPQSLKKIVVTGDIIIEEGAFYACANIQSVEFEGNVTSIGKYAFYGCTGIVSITLPDSVESIGNYAFQNCTQLRNIDLGNGVIEIMGYAFDGCVSITDITIPSSVEIVGRGVFQGCTGIKEIVIPDSVTSISDGVFKSCTSLEKISIPFVGEKKDGTGLTHFGHIFGAGAYLTQNNYIPTSLKTIVITGGESIAENAFRNCKSFTSIFIPKSVTGIGDKAFSSCDGLKNVYYGGTASEWNMISIGATNTKLQNATFTYNYDPN